MDYEDFSKREEVEVDMKRDEIRYNRDTCHV